MLFFSFSPVGRLHWKSSHRCNRFWFFMFTAECSHSREPNGVRKFLHARPVSHLNSDCLLERFNRGWTWWTRQFFVSYLRWFIAKQSSNAFLNWVADCGKIVTTLECQNHLKLSQIRIWEIQEMMIQLRTFPSANSISSRVRWPKQAGDTTYPPNGAGWPIAASNPAETRIISGANSLAIGMTTVLNAAKYSASPSGGLNPPDQAMFTLKPEPAPVPHSVDPPVPGKKFPSSWRWMDKYKTLGSS